MIIVIAGSQSANSQLYRRFWYHKHKWPQQTSDSITESLDLAQGLKYEVEMVEGDFDVTESFKDGFTKPHQKHILDYLTHTKVDRYPPAVSQTCVDYLSSVAKGRPEEYRVPRTIMVIVI